MMNQGIHYHEEALSGYLLSWAEVLLGMHFHVKAFEE